MKQDRDAEKMSERDVMNHLLANLYAHFAPSTYLPLLIHGRFAGSDTTAIGLRACFYYLVKNPRVHAKLVQELEDADARGLLSSPLTFAQGQALPYLCVSVLPSFPILTNSNHPQPPTNTPPAKQPSKKPSVSIPSSASPSTASSPPRAPCCATTTSPAAPSSASTPGSCSATALSTARTRTSTGLSGGWRRTRRS